MGEARKTANCGRQERPAVLLVDDDFDNLRQMAALFHEQGWETALAWGATDALKQVEGRSFDLVVTELLMPDKDGIELIIALKARDPDQAILAISGGGRMPAGPLLRLAEGLGAAGSLGKPLCNDALLGLASSLI